MFSSSHYERFSMVKSLYESYLSLEKLFLPKPLIKRTSDSYVLLVILRAQVMSFFLGSFSLNINKMVTFKCQFLYHLENRHDCDFNVIFVSLFVIFIPLVIQRQSIGFAYHMRQFVKRMNFDFYLLFHYMISMSIMCHGWVYGAPEVHACFNCTCYIWIANVIRNFTSLIKSQKMIFALWFVMISNDTLRVLCGVNFSK